MVGPISEFCQTDTFKYVGRYILLRAHFFFKIKQTCLEWSLVVVNVYTTTDEHEVMRIANITFGSDDIKARLAIMNLIF
jgi:hypothetical protein